MLFLQYSMASKYSKIEPPGDHLSFAKMGEPEKSSSASGSSVQPLNRTKKNNTAKPTEMTAPKRDRVKDPELKTQNDWSRMNFNRLACPVSSAEPDSKCFKSCSSGELDFSHLREHLKNFHACDDRCLKQTTPANPCANPMHISNEKLTKIKTISKQRHESSGEAWRRIYRELYPDQIIPVPYPVSFDQAEAVARDPTEDTKAELYRRLERCSEGLLNLTASVLNVEECLCIFLIVLGVIRDTGASPAAAPALPE